MSETTNTTSEEMAASIVDWINQVCPEGCWAMVDHNNGRTVIFHDPKSQPMFFTMYVNPARVSAQ